MDLRNMSPRKRLRCLRNAAWSRTKSRWYCRNAQVAQFLEEQFPDSRVGLQRRTRRGQRKVRLSVERLAQRCPRERVHACISELLYERANSNITLKTFFFARRKTASNMVLLNRITAVDLAVALVRVPAQNFFSVTESVTKSWWIKTGRRWWLSKEFLQTKILGRKPAAISKKQHLKHISTPATSYGYIKISILIDNTKKSKIRKKRFYEKQIYRR